MHVSVCLSACLIVCVALCVSVRLPVCLAVCVHVFMCEEVDVDMNLFIFFQYQELTHMQGNWSAPELQPQPLVSTF